MASLLIEILRAEQPDWARAWQVIDHNRRTVSEQDVTALLEHVDDQGLSLLHHAVTAVVRQPRIHNGEESLQSSSSSSSRKHQGSIIQTLLNRHPEATALQCHWNRFTPLHCAVQTNSIANLESDAKLVAAILRKNVAAAWLKSKHGLSPLALHIVAVSHLMKGSSNKEGIQNYKPPTLMVQILAPHCRLPQLEEALELLYSCNTTAILQQFTQHEIQHHESRLLYGRPTRPAKIDFWVWDWALALLKAIHLQHQKQQQQQQPTNGSTSTPPTTANSKAPPFRALHTAAQVTDCPVPFLLWALRAHPTQVRLPDNAVHKNLPLHAAAQWQPSSGSCCRKSIALTALVSAFPKALHAKNAAGMNPMDLEAASGAVIE